MEGEAEIQGLRFWDGDPTVELLESDDELGVMLLERCIPGSPLRDLLERGQRRLRFRHRRQSRQSAHRSDRGPSRSRPCDVRILANGPDHHRWQNSHRSGRDGDPGLGQIPGQHFTGFAR